MRFKEFLRFLLVFWSCFWKIGMVVICIWLLFYVIILPQNTWQIGTENQWKSYHLKPNKEKDLANHEQMVKIINWSWYPEMHDVIYAASSDGKITNDEFREIVSVLDAMDKKVSEE